MQYALLEAYQMFIIHSLVDGHLGWLQIFAIVNKATIKKKEYLRVLSAPNEARPVS